MKDLCIFLVIVYIFVANVDCLPPYDEAMAACTVRTGLKQSDIASYGARNENCVIDCTTKQAQIMSYFAPEGIKCHDKEGFKCHLGKCKSVEDTPEYPSDLHSLKIFIKSAYVPDEDDLPTAGASDTFVTVLVDYNGGPTFEDGELVCHTYVVQDNSYPQWKNFVCQPTPMKTTAVLKFVATDSDKPTEHIDILGTASESVEYLLNRGPKKLPLKKAGRSPNTKYYVEVEVTGKEFKPEY